MTTGEPEITKVGENVFQSYEGIDGESYNDYSAFTLNPDGTLTAYSLDFFDAGGEGGQTWDARIYWCVNKSGEITIYNIKYRNLKK